MKRASTVLLTLVLLAACATNPATGRKELNFYSEQDEIKMGQEAHEEMLSEYAVYDEKPELNAMVERIGKRIAAQSPRPNLPWTFTLLDTPMINAMALPGGYVYVTRGILERMNSEDELAGVIAHEVAHVAAKHSVHSMSTATLGQIGLVTAAVIAGEEATDRYGALVMLSAGLLFTKYSRQQESQADLLGTDYMSVTGYNPHGAENMLQALQRLDSGEASLLERYFADHPDPQKRVQDVRREIATLQTNDPGIGDRPIERAAFVRKLEGIVTGNSTVDTVIRGDVAYNRTYGIIARAPQGWSAATESGSLFAMVADEGGAVLYAQELSAEDIEKHGSAGAAVKAQLEEMGLDHVDSDRVRAANGQRLDVDRWKGEADGTKYDVETAHYSDGDAAVVLLHIAERGKSDRDLEQMLETISFGSDRAREIEPPRMKLGTARKGDTWESVAKRATGSAKDAAAVAAINGFDYPSEVPAGVLLKLPQEVGK